MSLVERAIQFIEQGHPREQPELILECVRARNTDALAATQRLYEDMYGGITFNLELKSPAAHSLVCWGEAGLDALVEGAPRTPASKNVSLALQILSSLAAGETPSFLMLGMNNSTLRMEVENCYREAIGLRVAAKSKLNQFMLSLPDDETAAMAVGLRLMGTVSGGAAAAKQLFAALATRWIALSQQVLNQYENVLSEYPSEEPRFQAFFEDYPQLLDSMALQVWPRPDLHGAKEPDFVIRRMDDSYLIVEIETPAKPLVTGTGQVSAQVTQAVTQAMEYRSFLLERFPQAAKYFPEFQDPECLVVIGMERNLSEEQRRALLRENQHRQGVHIVGFDWVAQRAEAITNNIINTDLAVRPMRMI